MAKYRTALPQLDAGLFVTDGGLETTLIFHDKLDLPCFAAFDLLRTQEGTGILRRYYESYIAIAKSRGAGFILESPTWRANADWGEKLGYDSAALAEVNRDGIRLMEALRDAHETPSAPMVISGCVGPRGDGYDPGRLMSADEAEAYHAKQIGVFADTEADMVAAFTMTNVPEAIGVTRAARAADMPVAISFTVETDGRLPAGDTLGDAIGAVDAATNRTPVYYMINCAHPTHFEAMLAAGSPWVERLRGIRANASRCSHAELDSAPELDAGDPAELGTQYADLRRRHRHITVVGGCCGTDHRHVAQIASRVQDVDR